MDAALWIAASAAAAVLALWLAPGRGAWTVLVGLAAVGAFAVTLRAPLELAPDLRRPIEDRDGIIARTDGYATSDSCLPCHPREHASWQQGFHRTMTQMAEAGTTLGDFDDLTLYLDGRAYRLRRQGDTRTVELSDPDMVDRAMRIAEAGDLDAAQEYAAGIPRVVRPVVMSTGSHHYQLYWYPSGNGRELYLLPFAYLIGEERWVPRVSVFLTPPDLPEPRKIWNRDCLPCHSTGGRPLYEPGGRGAPETHLVEAGIACEACHGPAAEHAALNRSPLRRYRHYLSGIADRSVTQPRDLNGVAAGQVCGQCHSLNTQYTGEDWARSLRDGSPYRAGADLDESTYVVHPSTLSRSPLMDGFVRERPGILDEWFWPDGEIRVVGREYNGVLESPCAKGGEFSCLSCHSIHGGPPEDRLKEGMRGDAACSQCHQEVAASGSAHTRHAPESEGGQCMNCHMPHTSYGLLKASRSHTVTSPSVAAELATGRPNACNLCHLDRTLAWTADWLQRWYAIAPPPLGGDERRLAAAPAWLLRGDAGLRALAAWHLAWEPAVAASGAGWQVPLLGPALDDPYDAVRYIAARSVRRLGGLQGADYDFLDPQPQRQAVSQRLVRQSASEVDQLPEGFFSAPGGLDMETLERLVGERDDRPVYLVE